MHTGFLSVGNGQLVGGEQINYLPKPRQLIDLNR